MISLLGDASAFRDCKAEAKKKQAKVACCAHNENPGSPPRGWDSGRRLPLGGSKLWGIEVSVGTEGGGKRHLIAGAMGGMDGWDAEMDISANNEYERCAVGEC